MFFFGLEIIPYYCLYYYFKEDYDKDYLLNDEYYNELNIIKDIIKDHVYLLLFFQSFTILIIIKKIILCCKCKHKFNCFKKTKAF